jgi:UDP-N-acetylglucosamine:LPS N-acetylglucosamine transferase
LRATATNIWSVLRLAMSTLWAAVLYLWWRPSAVVAVGGYAAFPAGMAAVVTRRPLIVVELDAEAGAVNRVLTRFAATVCRALGPAKSNERVTGAPLRETVVRLDRTPGAQAAARESLGIPEGRTVLVVMTGSLGATSVNNAVAQLVGTWSSRSDLAIVHVTGRRDFDAMPAPREHEDGLWYRTIPFSDDMPRLWQVADVALCRAGAATTAELSLLQIPSVLVPLPGAPGDHQTKNARALELAGGAVVLADADVSPASLATVLEPLVRDPARRGIMAAALAPLGKPHATQAIIDAVLEVQR